MSIYAKKNRGFAIVIITLWLSITVFNWLTPFREFSEAENRMLRTFPQYTSRRVLEGYYQQELNDYTSDQFLGREYWVKAYGWINYSLGVREINGIYFGQDAMYKHYFPENEEISQANAQGLANFVTDTGIPTFLMLVPSSSTVMSDRLPALAQSWDEYSYIQQFYDSLDERIQCIDICPILKDHRNEYIFYRTDHHWTSYGAFLAYNELAPAMSLEVHTAEQFYITTVSDSFRGTYDSATLLDIYPDDIIEVFQHGVAASLNVLGAQPARYGSIYFDEYLSTKDKYSYLLGPLQSVVKIETTSQNNRKLLIFKDSYAHCLTPMLLADFSEILLVDLRYYSAASSYLEDLDVASYDQALFLYSCDVFAHQRVSAKL